MEWVRLPVIQLRNSEWKEKTYSLIQFELNLRCFSGILLSYQYQLYLPVILSIKLVGIFLFFFFFFFNFIIASSYL